MTKTLIRIISAELGVAGGVKRKNSHRLLFFGINGALDFASGLPLFRRTAATAESRRQPVLMNVFRNFKKIALAVAATSAGTMGSW
jgi:hypothetical protein